MIEDWIRVDKSQVVQLVFIVVEVFASWLLVPIYQAAYPGYPGELIFKWVLTLQFVMLALPTVIHFLTELLRWFEVFITGWYSKRKSAEVQQMEALPPQEKPVQRPQPRVEEPTAIRSQLVGME